MVGIAQTPARDNRHATRKHDRIAEQAGASAKEALKICGKARSLRGGRNQAVGSSHVRVVYCTNKGTRIPRLAGGTLPAAARATVASTMSRGLTQVTPLGSL